MRAKYGFGCQPVPVIRNETDASHTWRGIVMTWSHIEDNITWSINNGDSARFWTDRWIPGFQPLSSMMQVQIPPQECNLAVSAYSFHDGWNWRGLNNILPRMFVLPLLQ